MRLTRVFRITLHAGADLYGGRRLRPPGSAELAEMGVLEVVAVLEAIAHQAVSSDVGEPDETEGQHKGLALPPSEPDHGRRDRGGVGGVIRYAPARVPRRYPAIARSGSSTISGTSHHDW